MPFGKAPANVNRTMRDVDRWRTDAYAYGTYGPVFFGERPAGGRDTAFQERLIADLPAEPQPVRRGARVRGAPRQEVYSGPHLRPAPDLVVTGRDPRILMLGVAAGFVALDDPRPASTPSSENYGFSGHHGPIGMLAAAGPAIEAGVVRDAGIQDLAPTVLRMLGVDAETAFDGRPLDGFRAAGSLVAAAADAGPGQQSGVYTDEEERAIRERISALGYE